MGLELSSEAHTLELLCDFMMQNEIDISRIAEYNTHWKNKKGYRQMKRITSFHLAVSLYILPMSIRFSNSTDVASFFELYPVEIIL